MTAGILTSGTASVSGGLSNNDCSPVKESKSVTEATAPTLCHGTGSLPADTGISNVCRGRPAQTGISTRKKTAQKITARWSKETGGIMIEWWNGGELTEKRKRKEKDRDPN
jgi:hypothetical protein